MLERLTHGLSGFSIRDLDRKRQATAQGPEDAVEIPAATKARLGLDSERSWVVVSEVNRFVWPGPDLASVPGNPRRFDYGFLPPRFFKKVTSQIVDWARARKLKEIRRQD